MISLPGDVKKIMNEQYNQKLRKPIHVVELPCTKYHKNKEPQLVEILEARDQKIPCPLCGRVHYLVYSKTGNHKYAGS